MPPLLLQPLVENAVRHGRLETDGRAAIKVSAVLANGSVVIDVCDDGPGCDPSAIDQGVGLRATRDRLRLLYGDAAKLELERIDDGFRVRITVPARIREVA